MVLIKEQAIEVLDLLALHCGDIDESTRDSFVFYSQEKHILPLEFSFRGNLGFGGKIYLEDPPRVSCYPEDETPEILQAIQKVNRKLSLAAIGWIGDEK